MSPESLEGESGRRAADSAGRLLSVNVGMPKDVSWQGKTVFTGVFKDSVLGARRVGKITLEGDAQDDLPARQMTRRHTDHRKQMPRGA